MQDHPSTPQQVTPPVVHQNTDHSSSDYPSSPIATAKQAVQMLLKNGKSSIVGFLLSQILLVVLMAVFLVLAAVSGLAWGVSYLTSIDASASAQLSTMAAAIPPQVVDFVNQLGFLNSATVPIMIVSLVAILLLSNLMNAAYLAYVGVTVTNDHVAKFGDVMRLALKRSWALLVQALLAGLVFVLALIVPIMLTGNSIYTAQSTALGAVASLVGIYYIALFIAAIVLLPRLAFAPFAVVTENMGPIQSLKYSWHVSRGKLWELIGAASVGMIALTVIAFVFTLIEEMVGTNSGFAISVAVVEALVGTVSSLAFIAIIALRYRQAKQTNHDHKVNYPLNIGLFIAALVALIVMSSVDKQLNPTPSYDSLNPDTNYESLYNEDYVPPTDEELQKQLDEYYRQSQELYDQYQSDMPAPDEYLNVN